MNKKLIYYWYVPGEWDSIYDLHLKNLSLYLPVQNFDEKLFVISYNKGDYTVAPYVLKTIDKLKELAPDAKFVFVDNDPALREAKYFYNEIAMKLGEFSEDDVIFWAHAKGKFSTYKPKQLVDLWINLMYFGNLASSKGINEFITNPDYFCLGTLFWDTTDTKIREAFDKQLFHWHYSGTFFWFKPYKIYEYIKQNNIQIPENNYWFAECFLGNVIPQEKVMYTYGKFEDDLVKFFNNMSQPTKSNFAKIHNSLIYSFQ